VTLDLVEVACPVCAAQPSDKLVYPDTLGRTAPVFGYKWSPAIRRCYRAVRCPKCSHIYSSPRLANLHSYYQDVEDPAYLANSQQRVDTAHHVLQELTSLLPRGRALDVGCSTGDYLAAAATHYQVVGLELSRWAAQIARDRGLTIHRKTLADFNDAPFDLISMWGVLEHLEHPARDVCHINRLLRCGGLFSFWTGDADSLPARLLKTDWWYVLGQHIQYFTAQSLDYLLVSHGFEKVRVRTYPYVITLAYLGTSLGRYPGIGRIARRVLHHRLLRDRKITLRLPGEMFGIYRKVGPIGDGHPSGWAREAGCNPQR